MPSCPPCQTPETWHGCYDGGWRGNISAAAFEHPAKMAYGLLNRLATHGEQRGWWRPGDTVGDPFGGVGTTGIVFAYHGIRTVSVELEPRFVGLCYENFWLHLDKWRQLGSPLPVYLQGDSRQFAALTRGQAQAVVTSPPYAESLQNAGGDRHTIEFKTGRSHFHGNDVYGTAEGQIGALKAGNLDAVATSPPYADSLTRGDRCPDTANTARMTEMGGRMVYADATPGQIGELQMGDLDAVATSPPYVDSLNSTDKDFIRNRLTTGPSGSTKLRGSRGAVSDGRDYGETPGQIGAEKQESYWQAMALVYAQVFLALKPGGVFACVVKDYVKAKARVPLCDQTLTLLLSIGFEPVERIRAMLVKETRHPGLFGEDVVTVKERKSFFRRLAESKGSPRIDHEEVIVVRKPAERNPLTAAAPVG